MSNRREIVIAGRVYRKNPDVDRYQIHLNELGDLRMIDIPGHSHLEVLGLPIPAEAPETECYGLNAGDDGVTEHLSVYGGVWYKVEANDRARMVARCRRAFPEQEWSPTGSSYRGPEITSYLRDGAIIVSVFLNLPFEEHPETLVRDAFRPFIDGYQRLARPDVHAFICHASEDKPTARELAAAMKTLGADVWFDEWEIRVGDSIVQKIDSALGTVSHLIVLLSTNSVTKPWVKKELSSALMRQLSQKSIMVLPLRLDDCSIPPILADIKYADARKGVENVLAELEQALFSTPEAIS